MSNPLVSIILLSDLLLTLSLQPTIFHKEKAFNRHFVFHQIIRIHIKVCRGTGEVTIQSECTPPTPIDVFGLYCQIELDRMPILFGNHRQVVLLNLKRSPYSSWVAYFLNAYLKKTSKHQVGWRRRERVQNSAIFLKVHVAIVYRFEDGSDRDLRMRTIHIILHIAC